MSGSASVPLLALLAGCAAVPVDMPDGWTIDTDGDGLCDADEAAWGTDPEAADTDGDDHSDGDEVQAGSDPLDPDDHPYAGGWPIDRDCRDAIEPTGNSEGQVTADFELPDQFDELVRLYDFCGKAVLLVAAAFW